MSSQPSRSSRRPVPLIRAPWARPLAVLVVWLIVWFATCSAGAAPASAQATPATGPTGSAPRGTTVPTRLTTPVFSARRVPALLRSKLADAPVVAAAEKVLVGAPPNTCVSITEAGRTVFAAKDDLPVMPASTNKLLTSQVAIDELGADTRLRTSAKAAPAGPDGVIPGDLFLVGGGDPLLFTAGFRVTLKDRNQPGTDFVALADAIKAAGITRVTGNIVGDDTRHDAMRAVPTWEPSYQKSDEVGALSALEVNRGIAGLSKNPEQPSTNRVVGDPPVLGAETLLSLLEARGVAVGGSAVAGVAPAGLVEVAGIDSLPVREIAAEILTTSDNTASEVIAKEIGRSASGAGTTVAGTAAITAHLASLGLPTQGVAITDGSGLDRNNRVTCALLTGLLDETGPDSDLARGLAIAGKTGTLGTRFRGTFADGRLIGKTGTLHDVSALAGFLPTPSGTTYTFAVVVNGELPPKVSTTKYEDDLVTALLALPEPPPLAPLGPKPPT